MMCTPLRVVFLINGLITRSQDLSPKFAIFILSRFYRLCIDVIPKSCGYNTLPIFLAPIGYLIEVEFIGITVNVNYLGFAPSGFSASFV